MIPELQPDPPRQVSVADFWTQLSVNPQDSSNRYGHANLAIL